MDKPTLRDYQIADLAFYMAKPRCGNFSDPGTGKTPSVCVYMWWLWSHHKVRSIWTMPKSLLKKNLDELLLFTDFKREDVVIVDSYSKAAKLKRIKTDAKVFLMGFRCFADYWPQVLEHHPDVDCLIGDEWHLGFKSDDSQRTQSLYAFMSVPSRRLVAMTGTIIDGRLDTALPLIQVCEPGHYSNKFAFNVAHAIENDYGQVVAWRNHDRIAQIFRRIAIRHTFEEAYGPEAKVIVHDICDMDPKQREAYDEFEETALLELEDSWLDGTLPGVNQIRARQLMEHPQEFGPPLDTIKYTGKEERLLIHLEDHARTRKPLVIFAAFKAQHQRVAKICEEVGLRAAIINSDVSMSRRFAIDEDFRNGEIDVIVASAATAGVGFNWGHVDHVVFMSLDPMDSNFVQAYRRAIRGKREKPLLITIMAYRDSRVEKRIFDIVEKKSALANAVDSTKERIFIKPRGLDEQEVDPQPTGDLTLSVADLISRN